MGNDIYGGAKCQSIFRGNLVNLIIIIISTNIHYHFIVY